MKKEIEFFFEHGESDFSFNDGSLLMQKVVKTSSFKPVFKEIIRTFIALIDENEFTQLKSYQLPMRQSKKSKHAFEGLYDVYFNQLSDKIIN
jgi:hypothetical protein